jgi:competence protein ComEC
MIDVGQGDAILLKFPNGKTALIDAGDATVYFDSGEKIIMPLLNYLGIDKIDFGFVSHLDSDHYGGFVSLIHNNKINKIIKPETDSSSRKDLKFETYLSRNKIPYEYYKTEGKQIGNVKIYCLTGEFINKSKVSYNNKSGVLKLVYGETKILFTGDIEKKVERIYSSTYRDFLESDILKVAHHGSKTSSTESFLLNVHPRISLISAGIQNKFRHPSPEIVERLKQYGSNVLRTDISGAIFIASDGHKFSVIDWK